MTDKDTSILPHIAVALERALRRTDPNSANAREFDAAALSRVVVKHWGDDAPLVLGRALELARAEVNRWRGADDEGPRGSVSARDLGETDPSEPTKADYEGGES